MYTLHDWEGSGSSHEAGIVKGALKLLEEDSSWVWILADG